MNWAPKLVIFDCDGVLVDSEMLSAGVLMTMMAESGFPITAEIFRTDFLGRNFASAARKTEERFGRPLPEDFQNNYRDRLLERLSDHLQPMAGVERVLNSLACPYCLATSSSPQRLSMSLAVTGLARFFVDRCFTASEVRRGKPAPDLCLYAAVRMGADPAACLVIEDSEIGIRAALAAGMKVWHFAGGAHIKGGYRLPPDLQPDATIADMDSLKERFCRLGLC